LKAAEGGAAAVMLSYGKFVNTIVDFLIVAFAIFLLIRQVNRFNREEAGARGRSVDPRLP
jgi:large conductance mechanosensitive channel